MTPEESKKYDEMFDTLGSPGWKHIQELWQEELTVGNNIFSITDEANLNLMKGRLQTIFQFVHMRETLEAEYDSVKNKGTEDQPDPSEVFDTSFLD